MYTIRLTSLTDEYNYITLEEFKTEEEAKLMFGWYEHHTEWFNGTLSIEYVAR